MVYLVLASLIVVIILTILGWRYYIKTIEKNEWDEVLNKEEYERHYVIIPDDSSSPLWQDIYRSAKSAAAERNAYVEMLGDWSAGDYSALSYMYIAIAAKVDGIIVKPDGTAKMREAIQQADDAGIPVITVIEDDTDSARKSFVGINSYQMGITYGEQILKCVKDSTRKITVLMDEGNSGRELIFKNLKSTVQEGLNDRQKKRIQISPLNILSANTFDAEEVIRDLFNDPGNRPDILVCMNETESESAYHAMVDYNLVGEVDLVGYYQSETLLDAIQKETVSMVVTLDTWQVGAHSVEALDEYYEMGHMSNYFSVDLNVITKMNVSRFKKKAAE